MNNDSNDILQIYQVYTEDIRHAKNQQWLCVYYGILIQAAIVGYTSLLIESQINFYDIFLVLVSIFVSLVGVWLLLEYQKDIKKSRNRIDYYIKPNLAKKAQDALDVVDKDKGIRCINLTDSFLIIFIIMFLISTSFTIFFILKENYCWGIWATISFHICISCTRYYAIRDKLIKEENEHAEKIKIEVDKLGE